jgi:hypothetical protein
MSIGSGEFVLFCEKKEYYIEDVCMGEDITANSFPLETLDVVFSTKGAKIREERAT